MKITIVVRKFASFDVEPVTFAVTGGTEAYANARGQVTEPNDVDRVLSLEV
jgi:hypothetical protein